MVNVKGVKFCKKYRAYCSNKKFKKKIYFSCWLTAFSAFFSVRKRNWKKLHKNAHKLRRTSNYYAHGTEWRIWKKNYFFSYWQTVAAAAKEVQFFQYFLLLYLNFFFIYHLFWIIFSYFLFFVIFHSLTSLAHRLPAGT